MTVLVIMNRIKSKFAELKKQQRAALITYLCGCDPDYETSLALLKSLPKAGADLIEIGIPFLDPSGDGPIIENASRRAIESGANLIKILKLVEEFRRVDSVTPLILMSYYNPILKFGVEDFLISCKKNGVDGVLIVDLPIEENTPELALAKKYQIDFIQLIAPTTDLARAKKIARRASGFLYYISVIGITGGKSAQANEHLNKLQELRTISNLPIAVGFGIKEPTQAKELAQAGFDGIVIGSTLVEEIAKDSKELAAQKIAVKVGEFAGQLRKK